MTMILVTERPLSRAEVTSRRPFEGKADAVLQGLLASHGLPERSAWYQTTLYQPTKFSKKYAPTVGDDRDAMARLKADLAFWCIGEQYPVPVVVTFGKRMAMRLCGPEFSLDDDFEVPLKNFDWNYVVFPLYAEPEALYKTPGPALDYSFKKLAAFVNG